MPPLLLFSFIHKGQLDIQSILSTPTLSLSLSLLNNRIQSELKKEASIMSQSLRHYDLNSYQHDWWLISMLSSGRLQGIKQWDWSWKSMVSSKTTVKVTLFDDYSGSREHTLTNGLCNCLLISVGLFRKFKTHKIYFPIYSAPHMVDSSSLPWINKNKLMPLPKGHCKWN